MPGVSGLSGADQPKRPAATSGPATSAEQLPAKKARSTAEAPNGQPSTAATAVDGSLHGHPAPVANGRPEPHQQTGQAQGNGRQESQQMPSSALERAPMHGQPDQAQSQDEEPPQHTTSQPAEAVSDVHPLEGPTGQQTAGLTAEMHHPSAMSQAGQTQNEHVACAALPAAATTHQTQQQHQPCFALPLQLNRPASASTSPSAPARPQQQQQQQQQAPGATAAIAKGSPNQARPPHVRPQAVGKELTLAANPPAMIMHGPVGNAREAQVVFMGTGSAEPQKYRGASAIHVRCSHLPDHTRNSLLVLTLIHLDHHITFQSVFYDGNC